MALFDAVCLKCGELFEVYAGRGSEIDLPCECGGRIRVTWRRMPGIAPDIEPGWDVQLGRYISSRQERDAILKEKGLVACGPDELRRGSSWMHSEEPKFDSEKFRDVCQDVWHKIETKEIPLIDAPPLPDHVADRDEGMITPVGQ
jgi:hypothetical protein